MAEVGVWLETLLGVSSGGHSPNTVILGGTMNAAHRTARLRRRLAAGLVAVALVSSTMLLSTPTPAGAVAETTGSDFWVAFPQNYSGSPALTIFISGGTATSGTVSPTGGAAIPFTVTPGAVTSVVIPPTYEVGTGDGIEDKGIHITAGAPVAVYGLNRIQYTTDAFLAIPTSAAGTAFRTLAYTSGGLAVAATQDGTVVTITPKVTIGSHAAGTAFTENLNAGQVYQLIGGTDASGTSITANHPISVYGFNTCTTIPIRSSACDHIVEQLPPTSSWGTSFLSARLASRKKGDTYRVLADQAGTEVKVNGTSVATLGAGEFYEAVLPTTATVAANEGVQITSSKPTLVAQYSNSSAYDGVTSDPFMMLIPPFEQFQNAYTVTTPATGFTANYINIVIPTASIAGFTLDGGGIAASQFAPIGSTGFSSAQLSVALGSHTVKANAAFGVFVYGFDAYDSYGYPGGYLLSPIASVAKLTLDKTAYTAAVGADNCAIANVTDTNGAALANVTVTFAVDKPTAGSQQATTDQFGNARVCFNSTVAGTGTLTATAGLAIGSLTATATVTWGDVAAAPTAVEAPPAFTG